MEGTSHTFSLLHLADLHERVALSWMSDDRRAKIRLGQANRHRVLGPAFDEILSDVLRAGPLDAICFTGDVADWGLPEEYAAASARFDRLLKTLSLTPRQLFVVPGNHDVCRSVASDPWRKVRSVALENPRAVSAWLGGRDPPPGVPGDYRERVLQRGAPFWNWLRDIRGDASLDPNSSPHGRLGYRYTLRIPRFGFPVHIIGLDSSWLAGGDDDTGKLHLLDSQLDLDCRSERGEPLDGYRIALVHHPLHALYDEQRVYDRLAAATDLLLHGHQHEPLAGHLSDPDRSLCRIAAGSLYEGDLEDRWLNAFHRVDVSLTDEGRPLRYDVTFYGWAERGYWYRTGAIYKSAHDGVLTFPASSAGAERLVTGTKDASSTPSFTSVPPSVTERERHHKFDEPAGSSGTLPPTSSGVGRSVRKPGVGAPLLRIGYSIPVLMALGGAAVLGRSNHCGADSAVEPESSGSTPAGPESSGSAPDARTVPPSPSTSNSPDDLLRQAWVPIEAYANPTIENQDLVTRAATWDEVSSVLATACARCECKPVHQAAARFAAGEAALLRGDVQAARDEFNFAREADPTWALALVGIATTWVRYDHEKAISNARDAYRLDSGLWVANLVAASAYAEKGKYPEAVYEYKIAKTRAAEGKAPLIDALIAITYHVEGLRDEKAEELARTACNRQTHWAAACTVLAERAIESRKPDTALAFCEIADRDDFVPLLLAWGDAYQLKGDLDLALGYWNKAMSLGEECGRIQGAPMARLKEVEGALSSHNLPRPRTRLGRSKPQVILPRAGRSLPPALPDPGF